MDTVPILQKIIIVNLPCKSLMFCLIKEVEDGEDSVVLLLGLYREVTSHIQQADEGCRPTRQVCPHAEVSVDYYPLSHILAGGVLLPFWQLLARGY